MFRHNATPESIAKLKEDRKNLEGKQSKRPPATGMLTKAQLYGALKTLPKSGQKIPKALVPKFPAD